MNGAGQGSTVAGPADRNCEFVSMSLSATVNWERHLCMYPLYFDNEGLMYSNTNYGDYPHYAPAEPGKHGTFTGWLLLSYNKPAQSSTAVAGHEAGKATDERVKSFWMAASNDSIQ